MILLNDVLYLILDEAKIVMNRQGKRGLLYRGYMYRITYVCSSKVSWECTSRRSRKCRATLVTIYGRAVNTKNEHNHPPFRLE